MLISYHRGQTSVVIRVKIFDSTVTTGAGKTGLTSASSGLVIGTIAGNEATSTAYTVAGSTVETITTLGTYAAPTATKCRFKEVDATNHPGIYEVQIADARFAVTSAKSLLVSISGATGAAQCDALVPLTDVDPYDVVRFGLTALPNVVSGSAGAVITSGTGTAQLSVSSGLVTLAAVTHTGATIPTVTTTTTATNLTNLPAVPTDWLTAAGVKADAVTKIQSGLATSAALSTVSGYIDTEVGAIKTVTDQLAFTSGKVNANVVTVLGSTPTEVSVSDVADAVVEHADFVAVKAATDGLDFTDGNVHARVMAFDPALDAGDLPTAAEIAAEVWEEMPAGDSLADIAGAVRDVSNASPASGSLGEAINDAAGGGGGGGATAAEVWAHATGAAVAARVALLPTAWPANLGSLSISVGGVVQADVALWRGSAPNVLASGLVPASAATTLPANAPAGWIVAASFAAGAINADAIAADAITAAKLAPDAIGASELSTSAIAKIQAGLSTYAGGDTSGVATLLTRLSDARATKLDFLDAAITSRMATFTYTAPDNATIAAIRADTINLPDDPASQSAVLSIYNNTFVVISVPPQLQRPASGTVAYEIDLLLYESDGSMSVPDSPPTVAVENQAGTSLNARLDSTTMALISPGHYQVVYTASSAHAVEPVRFLFTVVEDGVTSEHLRTMLLVEAITASFDSVSSVKLDELHARITAGRATNLDNLDVASSLIKAKTDLIPAQPAAVGSNMGSVTSVAGNVSGSVGSVTAPVTVGTLNDKTGMVLGATGLDAISVQLTAAPASFRELMLWGVYREWHSQQDVANLVFRVYGTNGSVVTTQPYTVAATAKAVGAPA